MDICKRIDEMRVARGWSFYKLSQESGITQQTFTYWMNGKSVPTIPTLKAVCDAFEISLAEFFADDGVVAVSGEVEELIRKWSVLTKEEKGSVSLIIDNYIKKK